MTGPREICVSGTGPFPVDGRVRTLLRPVLIVVFAVAVAACSGGGSEEAQGVDAAPPTTAKALVDFGRAPSTTAQPAVTSTSVAPVVGDEAAVRLVHGRFMTELFARDERAVGPAAWLPLARELTGGAQLARLEESTVRRRESGDRGVSEGYRSHVLSVEVRGDVASVFDCSLDTGVLFDAGGIEVIAADETFLLRQTRLERSDAGWLVTDFFTGGGVECDPSNA